jgi:uroporphyrinogen decarboxylase
MSAAKMTSMQRVLTTMGHEEPDRVPLLLPVTMHQAGELGCTLKQYFASVDALEEGQLMVHRRLKTDGLIGFLYAAAEVEAFGGKTIFAEDGPPNSSAPPLSSPEAVKMLEAPDVHDCPSLVRTLALIRRLKKFGGDNVPVLAAAVAPFSLPVMQLGFDRYLDLLYGQPDLFWHLMKVNGDFCVQWANAQLEAGATAVTYFDPVSSPTIIPRELYLKTGLKVAQETLSRVNGPMVTHFASGRCLPIVDDVATTPTAGISATALEPLAELKAKCRGRLTILGNLNAVEMCRWTVEETVQKVKAAVAAAGPGGGFVLTDNHGEIPLQVPLKVLDTVSLAVQRWGQYPLDWVQ